MDVYLLYHGVIGGDLFIFSQENATTSPPAVNTEAGAQEEAGTVREDEKINFMDVHI